MITTRASNVSSMGDQLESSSKCSGIDATCCSKVSTIKYCLYVYSKLVVTECKILSCNIKFCWFVCSFGNVDWPPALNRKNVWQVCCSKCRKLSTIIKFVAQFVGIFERIYNISSDGNLSLTVVWFSLSLTCLLWTAHDARLTSIQLAKEISRLLRN